MWSGAEKDSPAPSALVGLLPMGNTARLRAVTLLLVLAVAATAAGTTAAVASTAGFTPQLRQRIAKAETYLAGRPGSAGIVLRDRRTGAVWRSAHAATLTWACSTPKLAMAVDLLLRQDSGAVQLTPEDRAQLHAILHSSDNDAAHALWNRYGGTDFATRFPRYGLVDARFTDQHPHHWGWILTTANDLDRLVNHVLTRLPARHRRYLVHEMRTVAPNQQWGVWGAGAAARPGNKNGWCDDNDDGSWLINTVGFAGPDERYTLAVMDNTRVVQGGDQVGRQTTTEVSRILFEGYFGPA